MFPSHDREVWTGNKPAIVITVCGEDNLTFVLDAIVRQYGGLSGIGKTPRFNLQLSSLIYVAQGDGDFKEVVYNSKINKDNEGKLMNYLFFPNAKYREPLRKGPGAKPPPPPDGAYAVYNYSSHVPSVLFPYLEAKQEEINAVSKFSFKTYEDRLREAWGEKGTEKMIQQKLEEERRLSEPSATPSRKTYEDRLREAW